MAQTSGFQVSQMPIYHPVDPSLVALNPTQITHGLLDAYQLQGTVEQLKAFRQHAAEVAATEGVRTQLLQAQADQARIQAEHAAAIKQDSINAAIAEYKAKVATTPKEAQQKVAQIDANLPNIAPAAQLQGNAIQSQLADLAFKEKSRPVLEPGALNLQDLTQNLGIKKAYDAVTTFEEDKQMADDIKKATAAHLNAQASQANAAADELSGRNAMKEKVAAARAANVQNHYQAQNVLGANYAREETTLKNMESTRAENPADPSDQRFTVGMLAAAYNKAPTGFLNFLKQNNLSPKEAKTIPPEVQAQIDEVNLQRKKVRELSDGLHKVSLGMIQALTGSDEAAVPIGPDTPAIPDPQSPSNPQGSMPVYGIKPDGSYGRIK